MKRSEPSVAAAGQARLGGHAVVIGGSIAGMATARVLSDFFDEVTVIERDPIGDRPGPRKSVPQGLHYHALLRGGEKVLSELFPGFADDLEALGAVRIRVGVENGFFLPDGRAFNPWGTVRDPIDQGIDIFSMSRHSIEHAVRQRVRRIANVSYTDAAAVTKLVASDGRVRGVQCARDAGAEVVEADLIVDASGRGCRAPRWLAELGFEAPPSTEIGVDFAYSTAAFRIPDEAWGDAKLKLLTGPPPDFPDFGIVGQIEDGLSMVGLAGRFGRYPPGDEDGFFAFTEGLHHPTLFEMISAGERVGEIHTYGYRTSVWRHYEALEEFPDGYLLLGDAIASFNPVYGQGMSAAANQVAALRELLAERAAGGEGLEGLAAPFFDRAAEIVETPWSLSAGPDLAFPDTVGERPPDFEQRGLYMRALASLLPEDRALNSLVTEVFHLVRPVSDLFAEPIKARVETRMRD